MFEVDEMNCASLEENYSHTMINTSQTSQPHLLHDHEFGFNEHLNQVLNSNNQSDSQLSPLRNNNIEQLEQPINSVVFEVDVVNCSSLKENYNHTTINTS